MSRSLKNEHALVLGTGIRGVCAALALTGRGYTVTGMFTCAPLFASRLVEMLG